MYRRLSHIMIMITLILATAGVTVTRHYCGNLLKETVLDSSPKSCCGEHCNCCHNESFQVKVTDHFVSSDHQVIPNHATFTLYGYVIPFIHAFMSLETGNNSNEYPPYNSPPIIPDNPSAELQVFLC